MPSNWADATRDVLICPHCAACNVPRATPTIAQEQDGSYSCATCSWNWRVPPPPKSAA